ncbi:hypothetical protein [Chengkuizengella sediminis]|uniref:hypothetical protein n=1 Tax=Chengkuizengella sediminis TaxID=1885917 RepID=UPI0013893B93|nr:hypothetical protein [Chengkuizengella sediminis]NDI35657.1 hypothetical protein [Chengkuizengella sediminis]
MGLDKGSFVVAQTFSVLDVYNTSDPNVINLTPANPSAVVATVDVCVKQPQKTQVSIDSMAQIAVLGLTMMGQTFEVTYELLRNDTVIATINDEMDYESVVNGRHNNFPNFPLVNDNPIAGLNTYDIRCTSVTRPTLGFVLIGSRSLKATVFTV